LEDISPERQAERQTAFSGLSHDYAAQRALVDSVPDETLGLSPEEVQARTAAA
jgi:hypothetical protein